MSEVGANKTIETNILPADEPFIVIYTNDNNCIVPSEMEIGDEKDFEFEDSGLKFNINVKKSVASGGAFNKFTFKFSDTGRVYSPVTCFACSIKKN